MTKHIILHLFFVFLSHFALGQKDVFCLQGEEMVMKLDDRWSKSKTDSLLRIYDMMDLSVDSAFRFGFAGAISKDGWKVRKKGKHQIEVYRNTKDQPNLHLSDLYRLTENTDSAYFSGQENAMNGFTNSVFGYNQFKNISVMELTDGTTRFRLEKYQDAKQVLLSGSFNEWSTSGIQMQKLNNGWEVRMKLIPGRYEYKFIVDGRWMRDPENQQKLYDSFGDYNSVYFKPNTTFNLEKESRRVFIAGSFNQWEENQIPMMKTGNRWSIDLFLPDGIYQYKFIADGDWLTDPTNPLKKDDGLGGNNSVISIGEPQSFQLPGYQNARNVLFCGSFNDWEENGIPMKRTDVGWSVSIAIGKKYHEYRFRVDEKWITDPNQPSVQNEYGDLNNYYLPDTNHVFRYVSKTKIKSVYVTGSFCNWREPGFVFKQVSDTEWQLPFYLPFGKNKYKFVVDGEWILDDQNPDYEENEYGTGNSILWVK
jgi:hypothetical protein